MSTGGFRKLKHSLHLSQEIRSHWEMLRGNIFPRKPKIARLSLVLTAAKTFILGIFPSLCEKLGLCSKIRPIKSLDTIFFPLVFLTFSHFLFLSLGGLKGRGRRHREPGFGNSEVCCDLFIHPPRFSRWHMTCVFPNRFFYSCRLLVGLQKWDVVKANSFHFLIWPKICLPGPVCICL